MTIDVRNTWQTQLPTTISARNTWQTRLSTSSLSSSSLDAHCAGSKISDLRKRTIQQVRLSTRSVTYPLSLPLSLSLLSGGKTMYSGKPAYARCRPTAGCGDLVARTTAVTRPAVYMRLHMYADATICAIT